MDKPEFMVWLRFHCKRFAGIAKLMNEDTTISGNWFAALGSARMESLEAATQEIMEMDPQPFPGDHLGKLKSITKRLKWAEPRNIDYAVSRIESWKCVQCHDKGTIEVYHPLAYIPIHKGQFSLERDLRTIQVACDCAAGIQHKQEPTRPNQCRPLIEFDARVMKPVFAVTVDEQAEELTEFVKNDWNREKAFEWSG